jgi:hypothetical protein
MNNGSLYKNADGVSSKCEWRASDVLLRRRASVTAEAPAAVASRTVVPAVSAINALAILCAAVKYHDNLEFASPLPRLCWGRG